MLNKIMNNNVILGRYLYAIGDACVSFVDALLNKNYKQALWWFFEYYYSLGTKKGDAWQLLFQVYYDYYALYYPKMERFIHQKYELWKNGEAFDDCKFMDFGFIKIEQFEIKYIISVIKNLVIKTPVFDIFVLRQTMIQSDMFKKERKKYRFRKTGEVAKDRVWLTNCNFDPANYTLLWSIYNRDWLNICCCINQCPNDPVVYNKMHFEIVKYFNEVEKITINYEKSLQLWKRSVENYKNACHIMIAIVAYMCKFPNSRNVAENVAENVKIPPEINLSKIYVKYNKEEVDLVNDWNADLDADLDAGVKIAPWKVLSEKRLFHISPMIDCFSNTARKNAKEGCGEGDGKGDDMLDILRNRWMLHSYLSPIWKMRFDKYGAKIVNDGETGPKIVFSSVDKEEEWFEKYNLEPDECALEVQNKSVIPEKCLDEVEVEVGVEVEVEVEVECGGGDIKKTVSDWLSRFDKKTDDLLYFPNFEKGFII